MAQARPEEKLEMTAKRDEKREVSNQRSFKFNAQAPEFVPSSSIQSQVSGYFYPYFNCLGMGGHDGSGSADWIYAGTRDQDQQMHLFTSPNDLVTNYSKNVNVLTEDLKHKIIKQVEYQFSGLSLLANETLVKYISKDPEGYVPISVIASMKKIKSCINDNHLLAQALHSSSKLIVSNDGKRVRRKHPFTEKDKEELQSRTVVGENLPEDHSHQNLEKIFSVVGSVRAIRICHPPEPNSSHSKGDYVFSNKQHALVEYESTKIAEKAVDKLSDERNWRKGFRVRLLIRRSPKSVLKTRKSDFDGQLDEDDDFDLPEESSQPNSATSEPVIDNNGDESSKKGWARGRGKSKSRTPTHSIRGVLATSPQAGESSPTKQSPKGPRMPDGTRGFTMGRGKPILTGIP